MKHAKQRQLINKKKEDDDFLSLTKNVHPPLLHYKLNYILELNYLKAIDEPLIKIDITPQLLMGNSPVFSVWDKAL